MDKSCQSSISLSFFLFVPLSLQNSITMCIFLLFFTMIFSIKWLLKCFLLLLVFFFFIPLHAFCRSCDFLYLHNPIILCVFPCFFQDHFNNVVTSFFYLYLQLRNHYVKHLLRDKKLINNNNDTKGILSYKWAMSI